MLCRPTTNVDHVNLSRLPTRVEGPAISLARNAQGHRTLLHLDSMDSCLNETARYPTDRQQVTTPHCLELLQGTKKNMLLGHYNLFRRRVDNTGLRAVLQTPLAKQEICGKAHCQPRTASQNPPCSAEQAGHVLCDCSKVCGQVAQVSRSRRTSPFLKSTAAGSQEVTDSPL